MTDTTVQPASNKSALEMMRAYFRDFKILKETRKEYWGIQIVNILDCTAYFALLNIAAVFLSEDLGLNDKAAGYTVAVFTSATSIFLLFSGMTTDWLGIRRSLRWALGGQLLLRIAMVCIGVMPWLPYRGLLAGVVFLLMAPFMAGLQTIFQSATNRYTTKRSRGAGFNLWYLFMNIGAAAAGFSIDIVRMAMGLPNVHIFTMGVITALLCLIVGHFMIKSEEQLHSPDEAPEATESAPTERKNPWTAWREIVSEKVLWRLLALVALILGVRAVYAYLYLLMPKYWLRTIGPDAAIGTLNAINPIGIVIGLVLFIPLANKFSTFRMLVWGAMISSVALFPMAVPWQMYGMSIGEAHYAMALIAMILLTIGEVIWSPKLYEYTAQIAPKGQEGTYLGLSLIPWFVAKTLVSAFSGHFLERWSPEKVDVNGVAVPLQQAMINNQIGYWDRPEAMWLLLGLYALGGCIIAAILEKWFVAGSEKKPETAPATA